MSERVVLFPIEGASRELDYRVLLATLVADEDITVVLGQQDVIYRLASTIGGGIYVGQNIVTSEGGVSGNMLRYNNLRGSGFSIVHLDEEGGVLMGAGPEEWAQSLVRRFDARRLAAGDAMCLWGRLQERTYAALNPTCDLIVTGHPRFDVQKQKFRGYFSERVARIRDMVGGDYILVNTAFSRANHHQGLSMVFSRREHYFPAEAEARIRAVDLWAAQTHSLASFVAMVHHLVIECPEFRIVVRHHPSESPDFYRTVFAGVSQVVPVHQDAVGPWIIGAKAVIFESCTTGLEAWMFDKPGFAFHTHGAASHGLPNRFGRACGSIGELVGALREGQQARHAVAAQDEADLRSLIANLDVESSAFDAIANVIRERLPGARSPVSTWRQDVKNWERKRALVARAKELARQVTPERNRSYLAHRAKFQGFTATRAKERFDAARQLWQKNILVDVLSDDIAIVGGRRVERD